MKLSIQNGRLMVTLPQSKAKARALSKYSNLFITSDAPTLQSQFQKVGKAVRTGGTMDASIFAGFIGFFGKTVLPASSSKIEELECQIGVLNAIAPARTATDLEAFLEAMNIHNGGVEFADWLETQRYGKMYFSGLIAEQVLADKPDLASLFPVLREMKNAYYCFDDIKIPEDAELRKPYEQYAIALKLMRDAGQPQLADELIRVEGVAA
jgi:hypothetical protein